MEKHLPRSIFVFKVKELCCVPCIEKKKKDLLESTGIVEVDVDLENETFTIKGKIHIVELLTIFQKVYANADLIYYRKETGEDHDQRKESCGKKDNGQDELEEIGADCHEKRDMFKEHDQKKERRGKKEKECSWNDDEAEDTGADHYKVRDTFKDHKPEAYVPPSKEYFWGDVA
ncbi:hypothetical protein POM88_049429 [Heracleum sosnowskyi]|uniref:HMA domain-containing protein n=1 Tax=Heracleum sosnowskyi TaxID=360622 RepID=A0AAD8GY69_9APIA|nr:hypothetical protein POM88_049429 [Heracleum sosnowskyi]